MTSAMTPNLVRDRFADAADPLTRAVNAVPESRWNRPSPCDGWSARDVLEHIITTQREFLQGRDLLRAAAQDDRTTSATDPTEHWASHRRQMQDLLDRPDTATTAYDGFVGPTTVGDTLLGFYIPDMVVHRWDLASAVGGDTRLSDTELDRLDSAIESWGDALYTEGVCTPGVTAPAGADRQTVLLARMGRRSG